MTQPISGILANDRELFREIYEMLLNGYHDSRPDEYFILQDFDAYSKTQDAIFELYCNKDKWAHSAIINVANSGKFSSDKDYRAVCR